MISEQNDMNFEINKVRISMLVSELVSQRGIYSLVIRDYFFVLAFCNAK